MGGIALLALGGLVALAAAATSRGGSSVPSPAPGGYRPPLGPPPPLPGSSPAPAPQVPAPPSAPARAPSPVPAPPAPAPPAPAPPAPAPPEAAPPSVIPGAPSTASPAELVERLRTWLASNPPPAQVELVASRLEEGGMSETASQLRAWAQRAREPGGSVPDPVPGPTSPAPSPSPSPSPRSPGPVPAPAPAEPSSPDIDSGGSPGPVESAPPSSARSLAATTSEALQQRWTELQGLLRAFQDASGITVDGKYGPVTRAALSYWSGRTAPRSWTGSGTRTYRAQSVARGDGSPTAQHAERRARLLFTALFAPEGDARPALERFQRANGLTVDGKYGAQTRAAFQRLGVASPPPAFRRTRRRRRRRNRS